MCIISMYKIKYLKYKKKYNSAKIELNENTNNYLENLFEKHQGKKSLYAESTPTKFLTYGYIKNSCIDIMIKKLRINKNDTFYDLGSGIGNVCFKISYSTNAISKGYELVESRHNVAKDINNEFSLISNMENKVKLFNEDFTKLKNGIDDATIIFTDSIVFPDNLLKLIENIAYLSPNLRYLISMQKLDDPLNFELIENVPCEASWSTSQINIYKKK
jgi:hypothetical protein